MRASAHRLLRKMTPLFIQIRDFGRSVPIRCSTALPPPPRHDSQAVLQSIFLNLRHRKWNFLQQFSSCLADPLLVRQVLFRCRSSPRLALEFFDWLSSEQKKSKDVTPPDLDTLSFLIHVLVSAKMFDEALCIMRQLMQERGIPVLELLDALARSRKRYGGSRDAYDAIVRCCTQIGAGKDAYLVIRTLRARGVWVSIHACNNLLNHLISNRDAGVTFWKMYKEMIALGYVENVNTFNLLIYALCRECKISEAFGVLCRMINGGISLNVVTFNMLIDGCCRNGEFDLAYNLFKKMKFVSKNAVEPNIVTFNCLINALCKAGKSELGEHLVKRDIAKKGLLSNMRTYATLIDGYAREGKLEEALRLFIEMVDDDIVPNTVLYNSLLNWLFKQGHIEEAGFLLSDMRKAHASPDCFTCAIAVDGYFRNGLAHEALGYYKQIREEKSVNDVIPYNSLVKHLHEQGRIYEVKQLLGTMFSSGLAPDVVTYSTLIDRFFKDRNIDDALEVYDQMLKDGQMPNLITYNSIIYGFCQVEHVDLALLAVEELKGAGVLLDVFTYNTMIHGYLSLQRVEEACDLCHSMQRLGIAVNVVTCNIFMNFLCKSGCFDLAEELLRIMLDRFIIPDSITYTILVTSFHKSYSASLLPRLRPFSTNAPNGGSVAAKHVTRSNFNVALEGLRVCVEESDLVVIDLEMTGVMSAPWRDSFEFDRSDVHYLKLKDSSEKFAVVQFDVCPFR
ncbi:hypothetical protein ZIOFF_055122 [Zingiber officinale]|uniref:Pentatricopeptide repeat-containing protein n=1 Tax=Zingiber officinale TaxID=94328 RepID=A0A8J5KRU0_ZINOF|nr:hypothetical protein ZIOFF_055122 [Zingiber officinale]